MIGNKMKELRKAKGVSLTELSEKSGVQLATLSRMENQKMTGTLESHIRIAKALGVDLTELYKDIEIEALKSNIEVRAEAGGADVFNYNDRSSYEILTNKVLSKKMMPILLKVEPGGRTNTESGDSGSEKFIFVLEGHIRIEIADKAYDLTGGNTLYFDASLPHSFINGGAKTAKIISVMTPVGL